MVEVVRIAGDLGVINPTLEQELATRDAADAAKTAAAGKILGKFTDQPALESAYTSLEASNTRMAQELAALKAGKTPEVPAVAPELNADGTPKVAAATPELNADGTPKVPEGSTAEEEARKAVEGAGVDFNALRDSYDTNGALSEADYAALEKGGIPRGMVDDFVAGQEARRDALQSKAYSAAGDEATYTAMTEWAGNSLTPAEVALYNAEVQSGDETRTLYAVANLKARFEKTEGHEPKALLGGKVPGTATDAFESWTQVQTVMQTKEYKTDPAFRASVEAKLGRSKL